MPNYYFLKLSGNNNLTLCTIFRALLRALEAIFARKTHYLKKYSQLIQRLIKYADFYGAKKRNFARDNAHICAIASILVHHLLEIRLEILHEKYCSGPTSDNRPFIIGLQ